MNLLFPFFALAAAAIAIPILLHFRRQPPQKAVPFSSLMFLEQTPVPPRTRRKLEDWLLLALRCLALILLALMFARPFLSRPSESTAGAGTHWCFLVDVSASMRRGEAWEDARDSYGRALQKVAAEDMVSVVVFDQVPRVILSRSDWEASAPGARAIVAASALQEVEPSWGATDLGRALLFAAQELSGDRHRAREKRIVLISDLQEGSSLEALHAASWPADITVTTVPVTADWKNNLTLSAAARTADGDADLPREGAAANQGGQLRVRITSSPDAVNEKFTLSWNDGGQPVEATVPPGGSRMVPAPERIAAGTDGTVELRGDAIDFDNRLFVARPQSRDVRILCLGRQLSRTETASPLFYLARALNRTPALNPVIVEKDITQVQRVDLMDTDLVFAFGDAGEATSPLLREWTASGGRLVAISDQGCTGTLLRAVTGIPDLKLSEASQDALLQDLRFDHPLLRAFAESGVRDFTKIRFWKHRVLELPDAALLKATVIARFDDGRVAWAEFPAEKGQVLFMASGWQPSDSQLAVSSKFVPLLFSTIEWALGESRSLQSLTVGDSIPAKMGAWEGVVPVMRPDGKAVSWDTGKEPVFAGTDLPGIYVIGTGGAARSAAVNLAAPEGRLAPMKIQRLAEAGVKLQPSDAAVTAADAATGHRVEDSEHEQRQKGWKALLLAALVVLLLETWLAGRRGSQAPLPQPT